MFKMIRYMKPYVLIICLIIGLLFFQAMCDLALPDYMSNIVNKGIQQSGVENAVPQAMRASTYQHVLLFLNKEDAETMKASYFLLDKKELKKNQYEEYHKTYPLLAEQMIYERKSVGQDIIERLNDPMGKALLVVAGIEKGGLEGLQQQAGGQFQNMQIPKGADPFALIAVMPAAQKEAMLKKMDEKLSDMTGSMLTQAAAGYIKQEYEVIGMDLGKMQNDYILSTGGLMLLIALLSMAATVIVSLLGARVAAGMGKNMRHDIFQKVESFSGNEFDKFSTASLITRTTNDIQQIQMLMVMLLRIVFYAPILGIGGVIRVMSVDTSMTWIIAVAVMAMLTLVVVMFGVALPRFKRIQKLVDKLNLVMREALSGMPVIRAFNTQQYEEEKFEKANQDFTRNNLFVNRVMVLLMPTMMLIMNGVTLLIVWVGGHQVDTGSLQVGNMMAFMMYAMQIIMSFLMISMVSIMMPRASVAAQRVMEVINTPISIKDPLQPQKFEGQQKGVVVFDHVSFRYPGAQDDVLHDISFIAKPGETTALIGSTGSGKSTLINLIPRFYDVTEGQILMDGTDIRHVTQHDLREKIGYVPQKAVLFSGTIESNIKYADENASEDAVQSAARVAQALDFIHEKEEGFASEISQGGTNVSGGQKQRLSIARALLKKPEIYIFDDSFSALDFKTDSQLRGALQEEVNEKNSTVLIVAQRINTIMNAEQIIVLDDGKIVGKGTHKELMKNCAVYQEIALSQLSKEELAV